MSEISIKEHIIELLCHSGYGVKTGNTLAVAKSIGVLPETLLEAQARRKERIVDAGVERKIGKRNASYKYYTIAVTFSSEALEEFNYYCSLRKVTTATMIRSMLHAYLKGTYEPTIAGKHFRSYSGRKFHSKPGGVIKVNITHAAKITLRQRATAHRVSNNNLVRALIQEVMDGKICRAGTFEIVGRSQMYSDTSQYWVPVGAPGVSKSYEFAGNSSSTLVDAYDQNSDED